MYKTHIHGPQKNTQESVCVGLITHGHRQTVAQWGINTGIKGTVTHPRRASHTDLTLLFLRCWVMGVGCSETKGPSSTVSGFRSTSVGLTMILAADSRAVFPLL